MPVVTTVLDDRFAEYFRVLLFSIKKYNPRLDFRLRVLHSAALSPLRPEERDAISAMHPQTSFELVDESPYERFFSVTPERLRPALLKLDVFRARGDRKLLFLDADMLCLGDLSDLFSLAVAFGACPAGKNRELKERVGSSFRRRVGFNSGVMTVGAEHLDGRTHDALLRSEIAPCPTADQDILNRFFRWKKIWCLDHRYNYHAQFFWRGDETEVKILHYAGRKPLEDPDEPRMEIWFRHRDEMLRHERGGASA